MRKSVNPNFNSTIVRLKHCNCVRRFTVHMHFNSTIVRLKLNNPFEGLQRNYLFQFYNSSIKTNPAADMTLASASISILQ